MTGWTLFHWFPSYSGTAYLFRLLGLSATLAPSVLAEVELGT
jgi:hypothetical protein